MYRKLILILTLMLLTAGTAAAQSISQAEPIAHGSPAELYVDANRNIRNSSLDFRIVPHLGSTSIYVQKHNWKGGGDSAQIYVSDSLQGIVRVYLTSAETRNTLLSNRYYAELWQTDSIGVTRRIASGQILMSYSTVNADPIAPAAAYGDSLHVADSIARLANTRVLSPLHVDSIRVADSIARIARDSAIASLDSARTIRNRLEARITALQTQLDTAGAATRAAIEGDIAKLRDSLVVHRGRIDLLEAAVAGKQAQLSVAQLARIDSALAAGLRVVITSYGDIRVISFDTTGLMLGDMLNGANQAIAARLGIADSVITYITAWQHKLVTDTLDSWRSKIWAPTGGSNWTVDAGGVYRDSPVTIGQAAVDKRAALFVDGNVLVPDSTVAAKVVKTQRIVMDTLAMYSLDSLDIYEMRRFGPTFSKPTPHYGGENWSIGWVEYEMRWSEGAVTYGGTIDWLFLADSVNGVRVQKIEYDVDVMRPGISTGAYQYHVKGYGCSAAPWNEIPSSAWKGSVFTEMPLGGPTRTDTPEQYGLAVKPIGASWSHHRMWHMVVNSATETNVRLRVWYAIPAGNTSSEPIRFANN